MSQPPRRPWYPVVVVVSLFVGGLGLVALMGNNRSPIDNEAAAAQQRLAAIPFDGRAALEHINTLCALGPRPSGSEAMTAQQALIERHFVELGAKVTRQTFRVRHPLEGTPVELTNLIVEWSPDAAERFLLCAHYDTRPYPDRDPQNPQGRFVGANDGGSGCAVLMELGRHMGDLAGKRGVDFVFFDGEEFVFSERDAYFLGSTHFAETLRLPPSKRYRYRAGLLLDMVGDANLRIFKEPISVRKARFVVDDVWNAAARIGVREFDFRQGREVRDDHVPLNDIAHIPTADVIDFDYPQWHTTDDVPERCSAESLEKVGKTVYEWLRSAVNR